MEIGKPQRVVRVEPLRQQPWRREERSPTPGRPRVRPVREKEAPVR